jgi:transposase
LDPQIIVGLLVDPLGFPLGLHEFSGNKAETLTIVPVVTDYAAQRGLTDVTVVADAGMLTTANLHTLQESGFDFIVGSKTTKFPYYLDRRAETTHGDPVDGEVITWWTTLGDGPKIRDRYLVMQYRSARATRDLATIDKQVAKALQAVEGTRKATHTRFLKLTGGKRTIDQAGVEKARRLAGWKGYYTNRPVAGAKLPDGKQPTDPRPPVDPKQVVESYHQLFEVERSFRMSKTDLKARPIFHHTHESIQAHLTIVFAALAIARSIQQETGVSIRAWRNTLRPLRAAVVDIAGQRLTIPPEIPRNIEKILI